MAEPSGYPRYPQTSYRITTKNANETMKRDESTVRAARRLRWVTLAAVGLLGLATAAGIWILIAGPIGGTVTVLLDAGGLHGVPAAISLLVGAALLAAALLQLAAMLRTVERGQPFAAAGRLRRFALYLFLAVLSTILLPPLLLLATFGTLSLSLESGEMLMLFVTGLLFFVARLLEEAQRVADDHAQII